MGTLVKPTTKRRVWNGSSWLTTTARWVWDGSIYKATKRRWVWSGSAYVMVYSTPDVTASSGGSASDHGASGSGTVSKLVAATPGGNDSGSRSYSWSFPSGANGFTFHSGTSNVQNPTIDRAISGVANGSSSNDGGATAALRCTMTDDTTGAQVTSDITIGPFTWTNDIPAFTAHDDDTSVSLVSSPVLVPSGSVQLVLEIWGKGGSGGAGATGGSDHQGGGGGAGGYAKSIIAISPSDWGQPLNWAIGGGATTTSGFASLTANDGAAGFNATGSTNGNGNSGGTASGGNTTNATGATGTNGNTIGSGGQGGVANNGWGTGGQGGYTISNTGHGNGQAGRVKASWT